MVESTLPRRRATTALPVVRVCSVPSGHVYVRHLGPPNQDDGVHRLPDPVVPGAPAGRWWPSPALEAEWVQHHAGEFDVHHVHFGVEGRTVPQVRALVTALRLARRPLVLTLHDLTNPHLDDQSHHLAQLDVLVPAAAEVLTLTSGAAAEVRSRWGRTATVVPHPHVAPLDAVGRRRPASSGAAVVSLHLKSLRVNVDRLAVPALVEAMADLPGARLRVGLHHDVATSPRSDRDAQLVRRLVADESAGRLELAVHDRLSDDDLVADLSAADVSVVAYTSGTHSGWVELCHDLGTAVVASDVGYWREQVPVQTYVTTRDGPDPTSLRSALRQALSTPAPRATVEGRTAQRRDLARVHAAVYARAVASVGRS